MKRVDQILSDDMMDEYQQRFDETHPDIVTKALNVLDNLLHPSNSQRIIVQATLEAMLVESKEETNG